MPRLAKGNPTTRLNLELTAKVRKNLEKLRDETQADSLAEVIRRALGYYEFLWEQKKQGAVILKQVGRQEPSEIPLIF